MRKFSSESRTLALVHYISASFFLNIIWIIFFSVFELFKKSEKTIVYLAMSTLWRAVTEFNFKSDQGLSLPW